MGFMGGDDEPKEREPAEFLPDELEPIPEHASAETKWLYTLATVVQLGQAVAAAWGLNELSNPAVSTSDKIWAGIVMIGATIVCWRTWHAAYHSSARDSYEPWRR